MSRLGGNYGSCIETQLNHTDINIYEEIFPWTNFTTKVRTVLKVLLKHLLSCNSIILKMYPIITKLGIYIYIYITLGCLQS